MTFEIANPKTGNLTSFTKDLVDWKGTFAASASPKEQETGMQLNGYSIRFFYEAGDEKTVFSVPMQKLVQLCDSSFTLKHATQV